MSICPRCGEENAKQARFCSTCGSALTLPLAGTEVRKIVTVVFCDVANSTRLGERLDPEAHRRVMGRYFEAVRAVLERHGGTVEKFIGDAVMAVFGIPVLHEDDALRAVRAATEMREALTQVNLELRRDWDLEIAIRTGVNTGEVVTGEPGSAQTLVTGDAVVVAKRLEETAAASEIQIGEGTHQLVRDAVLAEPVGLVEAKGKPAIPAWRLLAVRPGAEVTPVRLDSPLVGRVSDLAELQKMFERSAGERSCRLFTVLGPAGIGKSRLTHELVSSLTDRALVLRGRCLPYGKGITFWPLVEVVKQAAGLTDRDAPKDAQHKIAMLLPDSDECTLIARRVAAAVGRGEAASARPEETFWAVRRLLEALARDRPLVVVFDDIQWAESTFLDLIEYVAGWSSNAPILICCLARPELLELRPSWGLPRANASAVLLAPLREQETGELIANLLGRLPLPHEAQARIATAAEGNPLFVEELLRMLLDEGVLQRENGGWRAAADLGELAVPPTIQALLAARLDRLEPDERGAIQRASVAGQVFWWGAVAALTPEYERAGVGSRLQSLVRKELIRHEPSSFTAEDAFRFGHILIRDAAYAALSKESRAELHERLAGWLERKTRDQAAQYEEILGYHLEQAWRYRGELGTHDLRARELGQHAAEHLAAAARRAHALGDAPGAVRLLDRTAALLPPDDAKLLELVVDLEPALREAGVLGRAETLLEGAIEAGRHSGDASLEGRAKVARGNLMLSTERADAESVLAEGERAVAVLEREGDDLGLARALQLIGQAHWIRCRCGAMEEVLERALVHAERGGGARERLVILNGLARAAFAGPMPVSKAIRRCEEILELSGGDRILDAEVSANLASLHAMRGDFDRARALCAHTKSTLAQLGRKLSLAAAAQYAAHVELLAGNPRAAAGELRVGYDALVRMGERSTLSTVAAGLALALQALRKNDEAWEFSNIAEAAAATDDIVSQVLWRSARERLLVRKGALERAEVLALEAVELAEPTDLLDLQGAAQLDLALVRRVAGRTAEAVAHAEIALERFERKENLVSARRVQEVLARLVAGARA